MKQAYFGLVPLPYASINLALRVSTTTSDAPLLKLTFPS
jgi:hypothetical protein